MSKDKSIGKQLVIEFLDFVRLKIESGSMTMEDMDSIARMLENSLNLTGTAEDFARFYGKTKTNVTTVIDRKMLSKPKRVLLHSFNEFRRAVPDCWVHKKP